jgi:hypothetical protein
MPTPQQPELDQPHTPSRDVPESPSDTLQGTQDTQSDQIEQAEQRFRTVAVRVHEELHSQLSFIAQLSGSSISEQIRQAIEGRIAAAHDDPALIARAEQVRQQIERDAVARTAAIAGFMGYNAVASTTDPTTRTRRGSKTTNE